ncbi:MAG: hypothetical protein KF773_13570, partial [Deltaproteobacteria bacterium]|nr:hypothetical protein [Deltaproteobacteria bacterium]
AVAAAGSGSGSAKPPTPPAPIEYEEVTKTNEYPLGPEGDKLVETYVLGHAIRDLGAIDDQLRKDSKLDQTKTSVTVTFKDGTRSFQVSTPDNNTVRYLLDTASNNVFVVSNQMLTGFENGMSSITLTDPRGIDDKDLESVVLEAIDRTKTIARIETEVENRKVKAWGDPSTNKSEPALANFIDGLANLKATEYFPSLTPESMKRVMRVTYRKGGSSVMGTLSLFKREKAPAAALPEGHDDPANAPKPEFEYFILTEKTHVLAGVKKDAGEQTENNLPNVMSDNPVVPEPKKADPLKMPGGHGGPGKKPGLPPQLQPPGGGDGHGH